MLSLKRIGGGAGGLSTAAAANYYEGEAHHALDDRMAEARDRGRAEPLKAADEYLMGDPSSPLATWWSASGKLAPDGAPIVPGQLRGMLGGQGLDGAPLVQAAARNSRVGGWDLTFSAPKDVGALYAIASPEMRRGIAEDMAASARAGLRALHDRGVFETRRGKGGATREPAQDVAATLFPQFTSRAGDPQPHVHAVLLNAGRRADGTTGALDPQKLYPWKTYGAAVFRAELANRLARRGVAILEDGQAFKVAGVPAELVAVWSKRRAIILDALDKVRAKIEQASEMECVTTTGPGVRQGPLRDTGPKTPENTRGKRLRLLKEEITQSTRQAKGTVPEDGQLEARWLREIESLGLTREAVWDAVRQAAARHQHPEHSPASAALTEALERSSVVTERTLRRMIAEATQARGGGAERANAEYDRLASSGRLVSLEPNQRGEMVFTTQETLNRERRMLLDAMERRGEGSHIQKDSAEAAIQARPTLTTEQARAIRHTARGDGVVVVEGVAGSGKSFALDAIVEAAKKSGAQVVGLAPSWAAADVVRQEARLPGARALQGFVQDLEAGRVQFGTAPQSDGDRGVRYLGNRVVLLVDEAGMAGSRDMAALLSHARKAGAQVVLTGDRRQLRSVEPGAPFAAVADALGVARMEDVRRQTSPWQREASQAFAMGDSVEGLTRYDTRGRIRWARDDARAVKQVADAWEQNRKAHPSATRLVLAARNKDVHALNQEIRARLVTAGDLGEKAITIRTLHAGGRRGGQGEVRQMELRAGDRLALGVTLTKTGRDVLANDVATLKGFTHGADPMLTLRLDRTGKTVSLRLSELVPPLRRGQDQRPRAPILQHAYARTIHKAQGQTADFAIIHAGDGLDASRAYVALTRHRRDVVVVAHADAVAQRLAADGEKPTHEAVRIAFLRSAKASSDGLNAADYVADRATWLRTGDPRALPDTARETRTQAAMRFARVAAMRLGRLVQWRPEKVRAVDLPDQVTTQPLPVQPAPAAPKPVLGVPLMERMVRIYATKVSSGETSFSTALGALVRAEQRDIARTTEYIWNPVHHIAIPQGGRRPRGEGFWMDRLTQRIETFERGGAQALWPEVARAVPVFDGQAITVRDYLGRLGAERDRADADGRALWKVGGGDPTRWPEFRGALAVASERTPITTMARRALAAEEAQRVVAAALAAGTLKVDQKIRAVGPSSSREAVRAAVEQTAQAGRQRQNQAQERAARTTQTLSR
jgi:conjugative relaxase-like TrwC/TraI family protein